MSFWIGSSLLPASVLPNYIYGKRTYEERRKRVQHAFLIGNCLQDKSSTDIPSLENIQKSLYILLSLKPISSLFRHPSFTTTHIHILVE